MADERQRVTILAFASWQYQNLNRLTGPELDARHLKDVLVDNPNVALFPQNRFRYIPNPTAESMRKEINDYVFSRGADNDILILYYSGHGAALSNGDFAFCTVDTIKMPGEGTILPMTAVTFTDILRTLWIKKITPIFIIDACYSGMVGNALLISISQLVDNLKGEIQRSYASNYALLCSAPSDEEVRDNPFGDGGFFSSTLSELALTGLDSNDRRSPYITLTKLYPFLREKAEASGLDTTPMLFLGSTLPEFSIFRNVHFQTLRYRLQPHLVKVLRVLWNDSQPRELRPGEIADLTGGKGAYGNHQKLSFQPWNLVETVPGGSKRRLNDRGIAFMRGELKVCRDIQQDPELGIYVGLPNSEVVGIEDFPE